MSFVSENKLSDKELLEMREKYLSIFNEFNSHLQFIQPYVNVIHQSFYQHSCNYLFLTNLPNDCDIVVLYDKIKVISDALKDFLETIGDE